MEVIRVENLSKLYRLGEVGTGTLSHDLNRLMAKLRGREDPYAKLGRINDRTASGQKAEYVWALKDIDFSVQQGEIVGVIGKNGAGKSTLLRILSQITAPTTGCIKIRGRISALLEVGTGFHPEMTGRENIFMNGTLLGMRRREIQLKLDDIVDFAGVALYLDTPVKRYSSGMMVRLGFAVAAFLEPEVLIVDEVLAVGDAEFQKKALAKLDSISKNRGRTVFFVSHNIPVIKELCETGILLENGFLRRMGNISKVVNEYLQSDGHLNPLTDNMQVELLELDIERTAMSFPSGNTFNKPIKFDFDVFPHINGRVSFGIGLCNSLSARLITTERTVMLDANRRITFSITIEEPHLPPGSYSIDIGIDLAGASIFFKKRAFAFQIESDDGSTSYLNRKGDRIGIFLPNKFSIG